MIVTRFELVLVRLWWIIRMWESRRCSVKESANLMDQKYFSCIGKGYRERFTGQFFWASDCQTCNSNFNTLCISCIVWNCFNTGSKWQV